MSPEPSPLHMAMFTPQDAQNNQKPQLYTSGRLYSGPAESGLAGAAKGIPDEQPALLRRVAPNMLIDTFEKL